MIGLGIRVGLSRLAGAIAAAYDYYVDSVTGDDLDTGLTPALAFATIDGLPTLVDGVKVGFAAGSTFAETLTVTGAPNMVLNGYGDFGVSGQPVFDGAGAVAETWAQHDAITYPNTWNIAVTHGFATTSGRLMIWEDGAMLKRVASIALVDAEAGTYYSPNDNNFTIPTVNVYAHATGSGNPNSNGKTYERTQRTYVVAGAYSAGLNNSVQNIVTGRQGHNDGSLVLGKGSTIDRCMSFDGHKHNALQESGICSNSAFINAQPESNYLHVFYSSVATGLTGVYDNTVFVGQTNGLLGTSGIYCHDNSGQAHTTMTIGNCLFANVNGGIGSAAVSTSAQGVYMENVYQPILTVSSTTSAFSHFLIKDQKFGCSIEAVGTHSVSQFASYVSGDYSFFKIHTANFGDISVANSTVVLNGAASNIRAVLRRTYGSGTFSWQNNIFAGIGVDSSIIQVFVGTAGNIGTFNNNVYYTDSSFGKACLRWAVDGVNKTFAEWQALGHDTNSIVLDETDILLADLFPGDVSAGDFRIATGLSFALPDATPIYSLGVTEHWNFSTKAVVAGAPERWVTMPKTKAQGEAFIKNPTGWSF